MANAAVRPDGAILLPVEPDAVVVADEPPPPQGKEKQVPVSKIGRPWRP